MAAPYPQIVLLGDSLLQQSVDLQDGFSFQAALQSLTIRRLDVINRGLSGWTTANVIQYIDEIIPKPVETTPRIKHLIVLLGANDAVISMPTTSQHVPIDEYKANLSAIIRHPHIQAHNASIILVTPPPVDEIKGARLAALEGHSSATRTFGVTAQYAEKAREVAKENPGVTLVDLWQALLEKAVEMTPDDYKVGGPWVGSPENGKAGGLDQLLPDGLHMSGDAYRVLYNLIEPHIGQQWKNLPEGGRTAYLFPHWAVLNPLQKPLQKL